MVSRQMSTDLTLIARCAFGLEAVVARELAELGYADSQSTNGAVQFTGDVSAIARANLWLRTADRVQVLVGRFPAPDFDALFEQTRALDWSRWIPVDGEFPVKGRSHKSQLTSVPACQRSVKKAIVESLQAAHGATTLAESAARYQIEVALLKDEATLTLDTTGPSLHKRGYRRLSGEAPIKETMAAALVLLSFWQRDRPLLDPFCGTGTIPIEAALIGRRMAPGLHRSFAADAWPGIGREIWQQAKLEALDLALPESDELILGTDTDRDALGKARYHAGLAGVDSQIHFQQRPFADASSSRKYGCVIGNPPYGQRLSQPSEIEALYQAMPGVLRRFPTWSHFLLTSHPEFEQLVGQQADRRRKLYNGRIECTYYQFFGPRPPRTETPATATHSSPTSTPRHSLARGGGLRVKGGGHALPQTTPGHSPIQAFGGLSSKAREQAELFRSRLTKRVRHLRRWPTKFGITCFRLYDRDIPELPFAVDRYEDYLHLCEYQRPHDRTPAEHADWVDLMVRTAAEACEVPAERTFLKHRAPQKGESQYARVDRQGATTVVNEGGLRFQVNLSDYLDTGLFLDHRITRAMVREAAQEARVLNLFGYTGAFSVYAAAGGAASTTTVDLSPTYLAWAAENMNLNGFAAACHTRVRNDALTFLQNHPPGEYFDLAVVDPPTFSNSKRNEKDWEVGRDHCKLLERLAPLMSPGGTIYFSTHARRFKLAEPIPGIASAREISRQTVPDDFRNRRIHRCWRLQVDGE